MACGELVARLLSASYAGRLAGEGRPGCRPFPSLRTRIWISSAIRRASCSARSARVTRTHGSVAEFYPDAPAVHRFPLNAAQLVIARRYQFGSFPRPQRRAG
jgi:hypothetical protein